MGVWFICPGNIYGPVCRRSVSFKTSKSREPRTRRKNKGAHSAVGGIIAGILFGVSFLSIARTLRKNSIVRMQLMLTAYGFLLFYLAGSATASQAAYPPYGLVSVSLIGLSCYLIYSGLYVSAQIVSQDLRLLRSIKESVTEQANFLGGIGTAQRNKELQSKVLTIAKNLEGEIEEASGVETSLSENEVVDFVQYVINELHGNKK